MAAFAAFQLLLAIIVIHPMSYNKATASLSVLQAFITLMEHARAAQLFVRLAFLQQIVLRAHLASVTQMVIVFCLQVIVQLAISEMS
jgi:hypothetical protein